MAKDMFGILSIVSRPEADCPKKQRQILDQVWRIDFALKEDIHTLEMAMNEHVLDESET